MKQTQPLNYSIAKKYAVKLWTEYEKQTDSRLIVSNRMFGLVLLIGLETSARISDLLSLKWSNIEEYAPNQYSLTYRVKKSKKNITIPLGNEIVNRFIFPTKEWLRACYSNTNEFIFYNYTNNSLFTRVWASNRISKANKLGLLGDVLDVAGSHSLRRTGAIRIYEKSNGDLRPASTLLGHKNLVTTSNYLQISENEMFDRLKQILSN